MRSFTIAEIKDRCRTRADMRNSAFVSDAELLDMINEAYAELYDILVSKVENYNVKTTTFAISNAANEYPMPDDFYKIIGVDFEAAVGQYITLFPFLEIERNLSFTSVRNIPTGSIRIRYTPAPAVFTDDTDLVDGISGWEALLITDVAIMMLDMEDTNTDRLERRRARLMRRIEEMSAVRDTGMPGRISDIYQTNVQRIFANLRYRLYGNNIDFISTEWTGTDLLGVYL